LLFFVLGRHPEFLVVILNGVKDPCILSLFLLLPVLASASSVQIHVKSSVFRQLLWSLPRPPEPLPARFNPTPPPHPCSTPHAPQPTCPPPLATPPTPPPNASQPPHDRRLYTCPLPQDACLPLQDEAVPPPDASAVPLGNTSSNSNNTLTYRVCPSHFWGRENIVQKNFMRFLPKKRMSSPKTT
jgi:hypothetical protein